MPHAHKIGAVCYVLWGLLHVWAGGLMLFTDLRGQLDYLSTAPLPSASIPASIAPLVNAGLSFHSFNLIWFGLLAIVVGVFLNWRNSRHGYWINAVVVGADDLGLILFLIIPGHLSLADAGLGPLLFIFAFAFTTVGIVRGEKAVFQNASQET